jgi:hypothetical protein
MGWLPRGKRRSADAARAHHDGMLIEQRYHHVERLDRRGQIRVHVADEPGPGGQQTPPHRGALARLRAPGQHDRYAAGPRPGGQVRCLVEAAVVDHDHRRRVRLHFEVLDGAGQRVRQAVSLVEARDQDLEVARGT